MRACRFMVIFIDGTERQIFARNAEAAKNLAEQLEPAKRVARVDEY